MSRKITSTVRTGMTTVHTALGSGVLLGIVGICYLLISHNITATVTTSTSQTPVVTSAAPTQAAKTSTTYKEVTGTEFSFKVPKEWSVYRAGDIAVPKNELSAALISVGQDDVDFGDTNWSQVDFYAALGDITAQLIAGAKKTSPDNWTKETVGGIEADVYTYPLEAGQVTKGGTGGKDYYLSLRNTSQKTLVIRKQAKGEDAFEAGFDYLIKSLTFNP